MEGIVIDQEAEKSIASKWEELAISCIEKLDSKNIPPLVGHDKTVEELEDLISLPQLFSHLIKPRFYFGFQGIFLFGPPGTGKTLLAQTLAARHVVLFFNTPANQIISKWVGDTEK